METTLFSESLPKCKNLAIKCQWAFSLKNSSQSQETASSVLHLFSISQGNQALPFVCVCKSTTSANTNKIETCAVRKTCVINQPRESVNLCAMNITCKILKYKKKESKKKNKVQHLCCTASPLSVALRQQRDGIKKQSLDFRKWVRILCKSK